MSTGLRAAHKRGKIAAREWFSKEFPRCLLLDLEYHGEEEVFLPKGLTVSQKAAFARAWAHEAWRLYRKAGYPNKARLEFIRVATLGFGDKTDPHDPRPFSCSPEHLSQLKRQGIESPLEIALAEQCVWKAIGWYARGGAIW